ncbi:tRNA lysidine(34) synthetase TilS [Arhodomonas sp. AD133]|uniref:tRNA lysidine(34) synthetase TilS n=1 Tax=Arhodomonas sp. AD133 TaxID=3415009 RepID=UPI003EB97DB5
MSALDPETFRDAVYALGVHSSIHVAVSGGLDSVVLLDLAARAGVAAGAVHVDHGLQPASARWARFVATLCQRRGIPVRQCCLALEAGSDLEARARAARYQAFRDLLPPGAVLATAHHGDDQAETVLLRVLRGAGVEGLTGIAPRRSEGGLALIRPLLPWRRETLRTYARKRRLHWIDDPTNYELTPDRNYLRHEILPRLESRWPDVPRRLARTSRHAAEAREVAAWAAERLGIVDGPVVTAPLAQAPPAVAAAVLRHWLRQARLRAPAEARLRQGMHDLFSAGADRHPALVWADGQVRRHAAMLYRLPPSLPEPSPAVASGLTEADETDFGIGRLCWRWTPGGGLPPETIARLTVSFAPAGARLRLHRGGGRQRLTELYRARGIAPWERGWLPLLRLDGEVVAVPGIGMDPAVTVSGGYTPVWRLTLPRSCDVTGGLSPWLDTGAGGSGQ